MNIYCSRFSLTCINQCWQGHEILTPQMKQTNMEQETLTENVTDYIQARVDLVKLKTVDKASVAITSTVTGVASAVLGFFIVLFLSFAGAYGVAEATGKTYIGFLAVTGFYALLLTVILVFKEKLITVPLINIMLKKFYWKDEEELEDKGTIKKQTT